MDILKAKFLELIKDADEIELLQAIEEFGDIINKKTPEDK